jgi:metallo-beta-lactamase family protein
MAKIRFHGAAQTVTGSMHILETGGGPVALDCGLFQGNRRIARERNETFPLPPAGLRAVVLSHAHIDHSGNIPGLVHHGFGGQVVATSATCDLAKVMLADSGHIQEEDARFWNKKHPEAPIEPYYTAADVQATASHFAGVEYGQRTPIVDGLTATFLDAGHILGSAVVLLEIAGPPPVRLLYTGDLGRFGAAILRDPTCPLPQADYLITECTYANHRHENADQMKERLAAIIKETCSARGKTIIPAFSVGRTQTLVYYLQQAVAERMLDAPPVFVDSPLSAAVTEVFRKHTECYDAEAKAFWHQQGEVFGRGLVTYVTAAEDSKRLNDRRDPCVIIASSGMCENGRILHHLAHNIGDQRSTIILVGYQAENTLGRRIAEGRRDLTIFGDIYTRRCRIEKLEGFSAHADANDFRRLLVPLAKRLRAAFVVHGEAAQAEAMKNILIQAGCPVVRIPAPGETFTL